MRSRADAIRMRMPTPWMNPGKAWTTAIRRSRARSEHAHPLPRSALASQRHVVLRALSHAADLLQEVVHVLRPLGEIHLGRVHDQERGERVVEEVVVVGAVDLRQVLL